MITKQTFSFLRDIKKNNAKPWFEENRHRYELSHQEMITFAEELMEHMRSHDMIVPMSGKKSLMRIYRDVRFSKDKTPYKTFWAGGIKRDTAMLRGGYYYSIQPGDQSFLGCGFWAPSSADLKLIRQHIQQEAADLRKVLDQRAFQSVWGALEGDQLKTAPKGFDKEDPNIDLLRFKQFVVRKNVTDAEVMKDDFAARCSEDFRAVRPLFDFMSYALTHDLNGVPLVESA